MRTPEHDIQTIRVIGSLILGTGLIQLMLTLFIALFGLFSNLATTRGFTTGILAVALSLIMASIMSSCAIQLQRLRVYSNSAIQSIRLVWTALVLVITLSGIAALWVAPALTTLSILVLLALFSIRPAIVRLSE